MSFIKIDKKVVVQLWGTELGDLFTQHQSASIAVQWVIISRLWRVAGELSLIDKVNRLGLEDYLALFEQQELMWSTIKYSMVKLAGWSLGICSCGMTHSFLAINFSLSSPDLSCSVVGFRLHKHLPSYCWVRRWWQRWEGFGLWEGGIFHFRFSAWGFLCKQFATSYCDETIIEPMSCNTCHFTSSVSDYW